MDELGNLLRLLELPDWLAALDHHVPNPDALPLAGDHRERGRHQADLDVRPGPYKNLCSVGLKQKC